MRDEKEPVGELPGDTHRRRGDAMKPQRGHQATEDDRVQDALQPDAGVDEIGVVKNQVHEDKAVYDAAQNSVVAVDVLVRRLEGPGIRVQGFVGQQVLDGQLRYGDGAESFCEMEIVF